jgi:DNA segregation ATPase FtsK/SpoIIIE, S-DNA-T family
VAYGDDVGGVLLVALAAVAGLGVYADRGGPAGTGLADALAALVGQLRWVAPAVFAICGLSLVWWEGPSAQARSGASRSRSGSGNRSRATRSPDDDRATDEDDDLPTRDRRTDRTSRTSRTERAERRSAADRKRPDEPSRAEQAAVGAALLAIAAAGILHIAAGAPPSAASEELRDAGGWLGLVVGRPVGNLLGDWGGGMLLGAVGLLGLVILTRTPLRFAADRTMAVARPIASAIGARLSRLFLLPVESGTGDGPTVQPYGADVPDGQRDPTLVTRLGDGEASATDDTATGSTAATDDGGSSGRARRKAKLPVTEDGLAQQLAIDLGAAAKSSAWKLPPANVLDRTSSQQVDRRAVEETGRTLERALAEHGVETRLVGIVVGPTVSRYELELAPGVKVNRVTSLHKDIAYAMATPDVRILAPIPGKQAIGIEVPNVRRQIVTLGDILASEEAKRATHPLDVAVGRDINGRSMMMNLAAMPHLLIAGATGAGKSSCLNSVLTSLLMRSTPDQVRLILVDPKRVEMGQYDRLPHLLTQVVTNPKKAANALAWAVKEMERRYDLLAEVGFRDATGYNAAVARGDLPAELNAEGEIVREYVRMPFILVVIDELADLMMVAARDVEESICRLAQMARAVGIHLVIATQRPSVNVITGLIKANVPARLAFAVSSVTDSRVILDQPGAERLIGKGDMLLLEGGSSVARRLQGAWVTEEEVRKVAAVWKRQAPDIAFDEDVQGTDDGPGGGSRSGGDDDDDDLLLQAMELVVRSQLGSTSMLQRKLRVGFARAGRLMDLLEQRGVVGPSEGSKARAVLMTVDELEELLDARA